MPSLQAIKIVPGVRGQGAVTKLPRTGLIAPMKATFVWSSGEEETRRLVDLGCFGVSRDVLFTEDRTGLAPNLAVKLQLEAQPRHKGWAPNDTEYRMASTLCGLIPDVYGCKDVVIGDTPCVALVVRRVPQTVQAFLEDRMRGPLTRNLLAGVVDMIIETMKLMCVYAGRTHQCLLADWKGANLGIEGQRVCLLDWERTKVSPEMTAYKRIKPAMTDFLRWMTQFETIPSTIHGLPTFRKDWMRKLGQIQEYLADTWWRRFMVGGDALPTAQDLETLSVELMVSFASDVANDEEDNVTVERARVRGVAETGSAACVKRQKVEKRVEVAEATCAEDDYVKRAEVKKAETAAITFEIYVSLKSELKQLLREDKTATVRDARLLLDQLAHDRGGTVLAHDRSGAFLEEMVAGFSSQWTIEEMRSIRALALEVVMEEEKLLLESKEPTATSFSANSKLCPAAMRQRALESHDWRNRCTANSPRYCPLRLRIVYQWWVNGHGPPRHPRIFLDQASLLLRCLHAHLCELFLHKSEDIPRGRRQKLEVPKSASRKPELVDAHWVRPYGATLLDEFRRATVNIVNANVVDTAAVLEWWLWNKVSTDGKKRFLIPPPGLSRCRCEIGWPDFTMTEEEFRVVIGKTMSDYSMARYTQGTREHGA